jgi:hypothetical protein
MLTAAERKRLVSLLGMLGSSHAGERDNAALLAEEFRRQHGATWADLVNGKATTVGRDRVVEREVIVEREVVVEREVIVERIVYVGLLGWLRQQRQQRRLHAHWHARRPWVGRRWLRRWNIDPGVAFVLAGIPLVMLLATYAPAIRAMLGY